MTDEDFVNYRGEEITKKEADLLKAITSTTNEINEILKEQTVSIGMSSLISVIVQMICLTSDTKEEAEETAKRFSTFIILGINGADSEGVCSWNATRQ